MTVPTAFQQYQRAVRGLPFTAAYTFGLDEDSLPDTAPTVTVVNAEGVTIATGTSSLVDAGTGQQTAILQLTAADLPTRDLLTVTWTYTISTAPAAVTSAIDVCDRRLFPLSDYAQFQELSNLNEELLEQQRYDAEDFLERECGCAFTGRYGTEQFLLSGTRGQTWPFDQHWFGDLRSNGRGQLALRRPFVHLIRSITRTWIDPSDSTVHTYALDLNYAQLDTFSSTLRYHGPHGNGLWGDLTIAYEHGRYIADVRRVCLILARYRLLNGPLDSRASQMAVEGGGTINLLTPGIMGSVTGIAEVDAFLGRYNQHSTGFISGL